MSIKSRRGIIQIRTLLALLVTLSVLPLTISVFSFCANMNFDYSLPSKELSLMDLRRILLLAYDLNISDDELNFIYHSKEYSLHLVNNKLILQPGTQIFADDIDLLNFYTKNGCIYLYYLDNKGKEYERNIGSEKGFYLNDFLDNTDEFSKLDNSDG